MADGAVTIIIDAETAQAEKKLGKIKGDIAKLEEQLNEDMQRRTGLEQQLENANAAAGEARQKLRELIKERERLNEIVANEKLGTKDEYSSAMTYAAKNRLASLNQEIAAQEKAAAETEKQAIRTEKVALKIEDITARMDKTTAKIHEAKEEAGELQRQIDYAGSAAGRLEEGATAVGAKMEKFEKRIAGLAKRVFVFTVFTAGLRMIRNWLSEVIEQDDEAATSIANLKESLLAMAAPLLNVIIPAAIFLTNVLTGIVQILGTLFTMLFGAGESADALNSQAEAIDTVGGAAKKASKQLAGFDTINKLSTPSGGSGGGGTATDLRKTAALEGKFKKIAGLVLTIGAAIAGWNIAGKLGLGTEEAIGLSAALAGLAILLIGVSDAWENGLGGSNILAILSGATLLTLGLAAAFGRAVGGAGLLISGIAMLVIGIKDYLAKGELTVDNLGMIMLGIMAVGAAIGFLLGSPIPALIGAVLGLAVLFAAKMGEGEALIAAFLLVLQGFIQFIKGVFTADWEVAWIGLKSIAKGVVNAIIALLNALIKGINNLAKIKTDGVNIGGKQVIKPFEKQLFKIPNIPYLARGAVIPPNQQFLAVLGDQKSGTNVEAPLSTIKRAVLEAMAQSGGNSKTIVLQIGEREFGRIILDLFNLESQRLGVHIE